jgi:hypothetical protein
MISPRARGWLLGGALAVGAAWASPARAHVGSSAVVYDGTAGPYRLVVTIQPPDVVPGVAAIDVRALEDDVGEISVVPLPLRGEGARSPPTADRAVRSASDPHDFTSGLWLMEVRPWQVRVAVDGGRGQGTMAVPVPALATAVRPMSPWLVVILFALLALLFVGAVTIAGAAAREADLTPGAVPDSGRRRRGRRAMGTTAAVVLAVVAGGGLWWHGEANAYLRVVYKPLRVDAAIDGTTMKLTLSDPGWLRWRRADDLVPDHGHPMHLFLVREPGLDAIAHLHPAQTAATAFTQAVPPLTAGSYRLFGDVVHASGLDETAVTRVDLPAPASAAGGALTSRFDPDDAIALVARAATLAAPSFAFDDGSGALRWTSATTPRAGATIPMAFEVDGADGKPVAAIQAYMGMAGHAMIVARDFSVFAHIHPTGSVPMAALALVEGVAAPIDHSHHAGMTFGPELSFPYAFPHAGDYRVFVQIKKDGRIETAAFDVGVAPR